MAFASLLLQAWHGLAWSRGTTVKRVDPCPGLGSGVRRSASDRFFVHTMTQPEYKYGEMQARLESNSLLRLSNTHYTNDHDSDNHCGFWCKNLQPWQSWRQ